MHCLSAICSQRSVVCFRLALLTTWSTRCGRRGLNLSSPTVKTFSTRSRTIATGTATRCRRAGRTVGVAAAAVVAAMSAATTTKNLWTASLRPFHSDVGWFWSTFPRAIIPKVRFLTLNPWSLWPDNRSRLELWAGSTLHSLHCGILTARLRIESSAISQWLYVNLICYYKGPVPPADLETS